MIVTARSGSETMRQMTAPEIADDLAAKIQTGQYSPGTRLAYATLAAEYQVPPDRIKRAMVLLRDRGLVEYWPGVGMHVAT